MVQGGLMNDKKQQLKRIAVQLFSERGYHQTSVQEIAKQSDVSKGAFYKHFDSKESLLIELLKDNHDELFQKLQSPMRSDSLSQRETLVKRLTIELEQLEQNKSFILTLFTEFPPSEKNLISEMMSDFHKKIMEWHKHCLLEAFGEKIKPIIWDLVACLEGLMKEYQSFILFHGMNLSNVHIASFITSSLEAIANSVKHLQPVLTEEVRLQQQDAFSLEDQLKKYLHDIELNLNTADIPHQERNKLFSSLTLLKTEIQQEHPKDYLLEALAHYLETHEKLREPAEKIKSIITTLYGKGVI